MRRAAAGEEAQARWLEGARSRLAQQSAAQPSAAAASDPRRPSTSTSTEAIAHDAAELQAFDSIRTLFISHSSRIEYVMQIFAQSYLDSAKQFEQHERSVEEAVSELCEQFPECSPEQLRAAMLKTSRAQAAEFEALLFPFVPEFTRTRRRPFTSCKWSQLIDLHLRDRYLYEYIL